MVLGLGDELSVRISAQTADFTAGVRSAGETLDNLRNDAVEASGALTLLGNRADEASDELDETTRSAFLTSAGLNAAAGSAFTTQLNFGSLALVTAASLVPALFTLSAALAPIVAAFTVLTGGAIALGGAFAGVIGLGIIGGFQEIKTALIEAKDALLPFIQLVGSQFTPLILDAIAAGKELAFDVLGIIGENADTFANALRSLGQQVADVIPGLVQGFFNLAETALPVFEDLVGFFAAEGAGIFAGIAQSANAVFPVLQDLLDELLEFIPAFTQFGVVAANVVIPALTNLIEVGTNTLTFISTLTPETQALIATSSLLAPVLSTITTSLVSLGAPILPLIGLVAALSAAFATNFGGIREDVDQLGNRISGILGDTLPRTIENFKQVIDTIAPFVEPIFSAILDITRALALNGIDFLASSLLALSQLLTGDFSGALDTIIGLFRRAFTRIGILINEFTGGLLQTLVDAFVNALNFIGNNIEQFAETVGADFTFEEFGQIDIPEAGVAVGDAARGRQIDRSREQDRRVVIELKDELLEGKIREGAGEVVNRQDRRLNRNV